MTRAVVSQQVYDSMYHALVACPSCTLIRWQCLKRIPLYRPFLRLGVTNEEISQTVKKEFPGRTIIINSVEDELKYSNRRMINQLLKADVVAFDTETKPEFQLGKQNTNKVALIQVANDDVAVLWRLNRIQDEEPPKLLSQILGNGNIIKIGHAVQGELDVLYRQYRIEVSNVIDTQTIAKALGSPRLALTALTAMFCGWSINKAEQRSNWERHTLTRAQISYAATDAWATLQSYKNMKSIMDRLHLDLPPPIGSSLNYVIARNRERDQKFWRRLNRVALLQKTKNHTKDQVKTDLLSESSPKVSRTLSPTRANIRTFSSNAIQDQKSNTDVTQGQRSDIGIREGQGPNAENVQGQRSNIDVVQGQRSNADLSNSQKSNTDVTHYQRSNSHGIQSQRSNADVSKGERSTTDVDKGRTLSINIVGSHNLRAIVTDSHRTSTNVMQGQTPSVNVVQGQRSKTFPCSSLWNLKTRPTTDMDTLDGLLWNVKNLDSSVWLWVCQKESPTKF